MKNKVFGGQFLNIVNNSIGSTRIRIHTLYSVLIIILFSVVLNACSFDIFGQIANVILKNYSDHEIKNITLFYHNKSSDEDRIIEINTLKTNETVKREIIIVTPEWKIGGGSVGTDVNIVYYINGIRYDVNSEEGVNYDVTGTAYTNAHVFDGWDLIFTIKNDSYAIKINK
jgi:hypothetical protein